MTETLLAAALSLALATTAWAQQAPSATELDAVSVIGSG